MPVDLRRALVLSLITILVISGLWAPLNANPFDRPILSDISGILIGAALAGMITLLGLVVPVLIVIHWLLKNRMALRPPAWAGLGALTVVIFMVVLNRVADGIFGVSRVEFAAPWPALIGGGAICGWLAFSKMDADRAADAADERR